MCDSGPLQVQTNSHLYSVCSMYTNSCLDLRDKKGSRPARECEVHRG